MNITELNTPYEKRPYFGYGANGNKVVKHNINVRHMAGNIYVAEPSGDDNDLAYKIIAFFPDVEVGLAVTVFRSYEHYTVEDILDLTNKNHFTSKEDLIFGLKQRMKSGVFIGNAMIAFVGQYDLAFAKECEEYHALWYAKREAERRAEREKYAKEEAEFVKEQNDKAAMIVNKIKEKLKKPGEIINEDVTIYKSRYESNTSSVLLYLIKQYGISCPLKTQGWINNVLYSFTIDDDGSCSGEYRYHRSKNGRGSNTFYIYINQLIAAVRAENSTQSREIVEGNK